MKHQEIINLFTDFETFGCNLVGTPIFNQNIFFEQEFTWVINNFSFTNRFIQMKFPEDKYIISIDIDENIFLPSNNIEFCPNANSTFDDYKKILARVIERTKPLIGLVDYDVDLVDYFISSLSPHWGNFLPESWYVQWSEEDKQKMFQLIDEYQFIKECGLLVFIHPLKANQAWSEKHELLAQLFDKNIVNLRI
jgi:hypothetical protein